MVVQVYKDGVAREENARVLVKLLELRRANDGGFKINHLLFADDTALVADSHEKFCRLVSVFVRECERRTLRVDVGWSEVMRCSSYVKGCRIYARLNEYR